MITAVQVQYKVNVLETLRPPECFELRGGAIASEATEALTEISCIAKQLLTSNDKPSAQDIEARFDDNRHRAALVAGLPWINVSTTNAACETMSIVKLYFLRSEIVCATCLLRFVDESVRFVALVFTCDT